MPSLTEFLKLRVKANQLFSREAVQSQGISDPFLWLDAVVVGVKIAEAGWTIPHFIPTHIQGSTLLPLMAEGYSLQSADPAKELSEDPA